MSRQQRRATERRAQVVGEGYEIVGGTLPYAPRQGLIMGAAICGENHVVLVIADTLGKPAIETHLDDEQVDAVIEMLRAARASKAH